MFAKIITRLSGVWFSRNYITNTHYRNINNARIDFTKPIDITASILAISSTNG